MSVGGLLFPEVSLSEIARVDILKRGSSSATKYAPTEVRTVADLRTLNALPCQVRACDSSGKTLRGGLLSLDARGELAGRSAKRVVMQAAVVGRGPQTHDPRGRTFTSGGRTFTRSSPSDFEDPEAVEKYQAHISADLLARPERYTWRFWSRCLAAAQTQVGEYASDEQLQAAYEAIRASDVDPPALLSRGVGVRCHSFCPLDRRVCRARRARFSPFDVASYAGPLHLDPCNWFAEELREVVVAVLGRSCAEPVLFWCPESLPDAAAVLVRPVKNANSADVDAALARLLDASLFRPRV